MMRDVVKSVVISTAMLTCLAVPSHAATVNVGTLPPNYDSGPGVPFAGTTDYTFSVSNPFDIDVTLTYVNTVKKTTKSVDLLFGTPTTGTSEGDLTTGSAAGGTLAF